MDKVTLSLSSYGQTKDIKTIELKALPKINDKICDNGKIYVVSDVIHQTDVIRIVVRFEKIELLQISESELSSRSEAILTQLRSLGIPSFPLAVVRFHHEEITEQLNRIAFEAKHASKFINEAFAKDYK